VINYDLPEDPEQYVHRIGRTGRMGRDGMAFSLVTHEQGHLLTNIERFVNKEIARDYVTGTVALTRSSPSARAQDDEDS
jgi:ATP-dependent RNA helicase DeaD